MSEVVKRCTCCPHCRPVGQPIPRCEQHREVVKRLPFWDDCGATYWHARCVLPYGHPYMHFDPEEGLDGPYDFDTSMNGVSWQGCGEPASPDIGEEEIAG